MARPPVPLDAANEKIHRRLLAIAVNNIQQGQMNVTFFVTLNASATSTTVTDPRIGTQTAVTASPLSASAAAAVPFMWFTPQNGSLVITHASNAALDQNFSLIFLG